MKQSATGVAVLLGSYLWAAAACAQQQPAVAPAPIPPQIRAAKSVFLSNACEQDYDSCRIAYNGLYADLAKWGRYRLAPGPADSDLVLEIRYGARLGNIKGATEDHVLLRVSVIDTHSHFTLWTVNEPIDYTSMFGIGANTGALASATQAIVDDLKYLVRDGATAGPRPAAP